MPELPDQSTLAIEYARRLQRLDASWWRRLLNVQAPYRWNIRRLELGRTLDVGCGIGRNLAHLDGNGVGVDHNSESVRIARERGFTAFTVSQFARSEFAVPGAFDSLLFAHVLEHMDEAEGSALLGEYLPYLAPGGKACFITPQERGYRTDETHVRFVDFDALRGLVEGAGLQPERSFSFPFPRTLGTMFPYNEFVVVAAKPPR